MRKSVSLALLALFVAIVASFPASVGASEKEVRGTVLVPTNGAARLQRCLELTAPGSAQGVGGWTLTPTPGRRFVLSADAGQHLADFDIVFYDSLARCEDAVSGAVNYQRTGDEEGSVPEQARFAIVTMKNGVPGSAFTYAESEQKHPVAASPLSPENVSKSFTVVAVIDNEFSPYHYDFAGHQHPWNKDADPRNDFDPYADPRTYLTGYPGSKPIELTIPTSSSQDTSSLAEETDQQKWQGMLRSDADRVNMYRFPGTKIIGAINFNQPYQEVDGSYPGNFYGTNNSHGTRSAASSSGNIHGTCPECLIVMISGFYHQAVAWAASQPWIDVVTNSWGESTVGRVRDNISLNNPLSITKQASEAGQVITWSAGNGLLNAFDVPILTYWSSQKGPDWIVTVGAAEPGSEQQYSGAGKPVDISSIGSDYPSTGGDTAGGEGTHSGTSNASPVVGGTFAKLIQRSRELLQDSSEGHRDGVVAEGRPLACGKADRQCPLGDGILTRTELERVIYETALPAPLRPSVNSTWPSTEYAYYYQGHGVISGRSATPSRFKEEQRSFVDVLTGNAGPPNRPAGEENWFIIDSKCRQRLWGQWSGGIYQGVEPELDSVRDPLATQFDTWCSAISQDSFADLAHEFGYQNYIVPFVEDLPVAFTTSPISSAPHTSKPDRRPVRVRVIDASAAEEATRTISIDEKAAPPKIVRAVRVLTEPVGYEPLQVAALLVLTLVVSGTAGFGLARKLGKI